MNSFKPRESKFFLLVTNPVLARGIALFLPHFLILRFYLSSFLTSILPKEPLRALNVVSGYGRGLKMFLRIADKFNPQETYYWLGFYELDIQRLFAKLIKPGFIVYDIGAYIGFYSLLAARLTKPNGKVYSFEPFFKNFERIKHHILSNRMENTVFCIPKAVADKSGRAMLYNFGRDDWGCLTNIGHPENQRLTGPPALSVETLSLDDFVFQKGYPAANLIKIDVQGEEDKVLIGAKRLLKEYKPLIICELHNTEATKKVYEELASLGYKLKDFNCHYVIGWPNGQALP